MINKQIGCDKLNLDPDILAKAWDGDAIAQLKLGKVLFAKNDYLNSFELLLRSAEQGNMEAQFRLANLYALGQGAQISQENAYRWYTKAALQGYKKALIRIHNLYQQDKRMYCRGQLNSSEKIWDDEEFKKKNNVRELNEYRREQYVPVLNNAVDYYTDKFRYYKSSHQENTEFDLNLAFLYQYGYGTKKNILLAFDFYKKAAEQDHRDAQYGLAYLYQNNPQIKFNYRHALRWYRASATNGNVAAQNCLGYFYEKGLGTELNFEGALYWYTKAANAENSSAQLTLGRLYRKGQGVTQSLSEAAKWYRLAANQGNSAAQNCLNQLYLTGKIPNISNNKDSVSQLPATFTLRSKLQRDINNHRNSACMNKLKPLAQHALMTDGNAMYQIGLKYYNCEDFSQDKDAGFQWIKKAAKAGLEVAESKIAEMYKDGEEVDLDYHKSSIWTIKTVKKRNGTGMLKLGILYKNGFGVRKDPLEASKWFLKSVEEGNTHAQFQFGLLKYYGEGVRKDEGEALIFLFKSALSGNANALYRFGQMYENDDFAGKDIPRKIRIFISALTEKNDKETATFKIYQVAANLGGEDAQFRIANIYEEGKLVKQDLEKAHEYYIKAANSNNPYYQTELALKYINGVIADPDYIMAFTLFKKAVEKGEPRANLIFQTPIQYTGAINDYSKVLDMFILAASRGIKGLEYNIGYAYEHGITIENKVIFPRHYPYSKYWYSLASKRCHYRAEYNTKIMHEHEEHIDNYLKIASGSYHLVYEHGNSEISYNLALIHQHGKYGIPQDLIKAFNLFTAASNMGHEDARKRLQCSSDRENMEMLEAVADSGNVAVQYQLGVFFENTNVSKSIQWLTLAAQGGLSDACYRLGKLYEEERRLSGNYQKVIEWYEKAIEGDHEDALYRLAQICHHGKVIDHNYLKAYHLYTKAASFGHTGAVKVLDLNAEQKTGSHKKTNEEFISIFEYVAEHGDVDLQFKLGNFYESNSDNQSYSKAFKWYKLAAKNDHIEATYRLGLLYEKGMGVNQNYNMAVQLYSQARDQGSHHALYRLGIAFHHGYGVDQDQTKAVNCYIKAAKLGNHESQYVLGKLYETAEIVQKDLIRALVLYTNAYTNENTGVQSSLYSLYDDQPYECFFNQKLLRILSRFEKPEEADDSIYQNDYGYMYYRLGRMYLEGAGTKKNAVRALEFFLKAQDQYGYSNLENFTAFIYDQHSDKKDKYIQRMKAYFEIRNNISGGLQYKIGMTLYKDKKCYCKGHEKNKTDHTPFVDPSKQYCTAFDFLSLASKKNHRKAQCQLGIMYLLGHGVQKNEDAAVELFEKSVETMTPDICYQQGIELYHRKDISQNYKISSIYIKKAAETNHFDAMVQLAIMYRQGYGVEKNVEESNKWIQQSIERLDEYKCYHQGMKFYKGDDVDRDYGIALMYFEGAAEKNNGSAMAKLVIMYRQGYGVEKNVEEANKWIQQSIERLDEYKCYHQGMKFYKGDDVDRDYGIALMYFERAAEKRNNSAMTQLAIMYCQGYGVEKSEEKAHIWIQLSIEKMDDYSCFLQGMKFYKGDDVDKDYGIALVYFEGAAETNHTDAMAQLAIMYSQGYGVEKNEEEAHKWIQKSIDRMNGYGCYRQGMKFYKGDNVDRDYEIALIYFRKAADKGHVYSQIQLGHIYLNGHGVNQDNYEAVQWYNKVLNDYSTYSAFTIGQIYHFDGGGIQNFLKAFEWYLRESNHKDSGYSLHGIGLLYEYGDGVGRDYQKAFEYYQRALRIGKIGGCYNLALLYYHGRGVKQSYDGAFSFFSKVLDDKTFSEEMYVLVQDVNLDSKNVTAEVVQRKYSLVSSERIRGEAYYYIGLIYENDQGRAQDKQKARKHFKKALELGVKHASYFLK